MKNTTGMTWWIIAVRGTMSSSTLVEKSIALAYASSELMRV
jgi:hypothetical protein